MKRQCSGSTADPTQLKRWVDPSFSDLPWESVSQQKKPRSRGVSKRPIKRSTDLGTELGKGAHFSQDLPWVDRHTPNTQVELAVHKKKIEEVESWLSEHLNSAKGGVLLVTGPSGCGKTATVRVLCKELGARLQEWRNPVHLEPTCQQEWQVNGLSGIPGSQVQQFQEFLLRANKYSCLQMSGDTATPQKKTILVEDFPNQVYRQPDSLHNILRVFMRSSRCPLVFIVSDSVSADSSSRRLFPRDVLEELRIATISFNPVAPTAMMKALSRIAALEVERSGGRLSAPDHLLLERLCSESSGDIRSAINSLQFSCIPDLSLETELLKTFKEKTFQTSKRQGRAKANRGKSKHKVTSEEEEQTIGGKDSTLFLFRALGKILHCKRGLPEGAVTSERESSLPAHLSEHRREPLLADPELVVERSHMSADLFSLYLHQNYLDFFCEAEDVDRASQYLSDADLLSANWTTRSLMCDYSSSVATRGILHSSSQQISVGFRPLHKPHWLHVHKTYRGNCQAVQCLFRNYCLTPVDLQTELLPFLAKLSNPMRNQAQIDLIQDVGQMNLRRSVGRLKLEAVAEKECAPTCEDSEEEELPREEGLSSSQSQPGSTQALLQTEELLIEEYDTD